MKPVQATENSKEECTPAAEDPGECGTGDALIAGEGVNDEKSEATPAVAVAAPIADGSWFSFFSSCKKFMQYFVLHI